MPSFLQPQIYIRKTLTKNNQIKAHLALLGANLIYGANFLIAKGVMPDKIGPSAFVYTRLIFCTALFWLIKLLFIKEGIEKKDILRLALCGFLGAAINMLFFFHGLNLTSPIDGSIIMTATPVIILFFSFLILKERVTKLKLFGITISGIGAIILILYGNKAVGTSSFLGNLLVFLNASSYGLYIVLAKTLMKKYHAITVISWVFLFGFIFVSPVGLPNLLNTNFEAFTSSTYLSISYVVLFTTFFTYLLNIYALNHVSASVTGSYIYLQPVISFFMVSVSAYFLANQQYANDINPIKILCCFIVVIGVYLISKPDKKKQLN